MKSTQALADRLAIYLAAYKHYVDIKSNAGLLDVAIFGEPLARDLAEIVFGYKDLVNLNLKTSFPAIDLGSLSAACAIQVTISGTSSKIVETQEKFFEHGLDSTYSRLKFIILKDKQGTYDSQRIVRTRDAFSFDPDQDIYDLNDLFRILVLEANPTKFEAFSNRLESELGSAIRPFLVDADRSGQRLRSLFYSHEVRPTDAVQALKPFNVTRSVYSDTTSLADAATKDLIQYVAKQFNVSDEWIDGTYAHIYSGGPGEEEGTAWRRGLREAYDLVERASLDGETLSVIIGSESSLRELDAIKDVVDHKVRNYEHFFLVAEKKNDFAVDSFRSVISDPLSYQKCRDGIFLLFVAAEMYERETGKTTYIDVYEAPRERILSCYLGDTFLVDLVRDGQVVRNHKDFFYTGAGGVLNATKAVPKRLAPWIQERLEKFVGQRSCALPVEVVFP